MANPEARERAERWERWERSKRSHLLLLFLSTFQFSLHLKSDAQETILLKNLLKEPKVKS